MKTGIELIAQERADQIEKHDLSIANDVKTNERGELRMVALALVSNKGEGDWNQIPIYWDTATCANMMNKPYKERLVIAASLLAAEIDRLQTYETK